MTKRSEPTPGPWGTDHHAEMHLNDTWIAVVEGPDGEGELGNVVAYCHPDNAPVLAAAPALLEALEAIASLDGDSMSDAGDAVDIAREAIAQARVGRAGSD